MKQIEYFLLNTVAYQWILYNSSAEVENMSANQRTAILYTEQNRESTKDVWIA